MLYHPSGINKTDRAWRTYDTLRASLRATLWPTPAIIARTGQPAERQAQIDVAEWSPDGSMLITAGEERIVRVWNVDGVRDRKTEKRFDPVTAAALTWPTDGVSSSVTATPAVPGTVEYVKCAAWPRRPESRDAPGMSAAMLAAHHRRPLAANVAAAAAPGPGGRVVSASVGAGSSSSTAPGTKQPSPNPSMGTTWKPDGFVTITNQNRVAFYDLRSATGVAASHTLPATTQPIGCSLLPMSEGASGSTHALDPANPYLLVGSGSTSCSGMLLFDARGSLAKPAAQWSSAYLVNSFAVDLGSPAALVGPRVFCATEDKRLEVVNPYRLDQERHVTGNGIWAANAPCTAVAVDPQRRYIAVGAHDSTVSLYQWNDLMPVRTCKYEDDAPIRDLSFNFDGDILSGVASDSSNIFSWATEYGLPAFVTSLPPPFTTVDKIQWHPTRNVAALITYKKDKNIIAAAGKIMMMSVQSG
ncbi:WD40-repeat-containing domain protein [Blastocladiella britannica]|nr:WD40-repeat-containing domain protein [Blastocladiella britannica]